MSAFKFVAIPTGSGWMSGHVAVDEYYKWPNRKNGEHICLNLDTENYNEFCLEADKLIAELQALKKVARRQFSAKEAVALIKLKDQASATIS